MAQVEELLTRYGPIGEVWIDIPRLLPRDFRQALYNHGVDLMGNSGGMVSSAHGEREVGETILAVGAAVADLRAEGLLD